jgi:glycosyltransferase involved in cell wall biosynthesis
VRVLHIVTAFPRSPDDVIVPWLVVLLRRLRAAGCEAEVFTSAYRGGGNTAFAGIPVHRFRYFPARWEDLTHDEATPDRIKRSWRYRLMPACYLAAGCVAVWRLCRKQRYDIVHVHWPFPHALFGWVARHACGARVVATFYGAEVRWVKGPLKPFKWFLTWAARAADAPVAISRYTADEVQEAAHVPLEVIPYGVAGVAGEPDGTAPIRSASSPARPYTALFVGRLVARKGVSTLIEALALLPHALDARVTVVGDGPERAALATLARERGLGARVTFRGRVPDAELRAAYRSADVLVLPSVVDTRGDTEGLGVVLLEAMAFGVPVVASRLGGITDIVTDGVTGRLVPPGDAAALAAALTGLARDPALGLRLVEGGRRLLREQFSWPAITARWLAVYERVLATPR